MPTSNYTIVGVRYGVKAKLTKLTVRHGVNDVLFGTVAPALKGVRVDAIAGNHSIRAWSTVKFQRLPDGRTTWGFVIPFSVRNAATIRVWAVASGNYRNATGSSPKIKLIVI
jgi:hypothetical protein